MNATDFNVLSQFIYARYLSRNIMILIKRTKMRENARRSDKWNSLLPREKRKSSLPQCSCTRYVCRLGTHKERHFVLILFLLDSRMRRRQAVRVMAGLVYCTSRRNAKLLFFAVASFIRRFSGWH